MYRDDLAALQARYDALDPASPEREEVRAAHATVARQQGVPLLDELRVATPCRERWDDMLGYGRVRFCTKCAKNVYDLLAMTRAEAEDLVIATEGRFCARLFRRADGTVLTADCPEGRRRVRTRLAVVAAGAAVAIAAAVGANAAPAIEPSEDPVTETGPQMGGIEGIPRAPSSTFGGTLEPFRSRVDLESGGGAPALEALTDSVGGVAYPFELPPRR